MILVSRRKRSEVQTRDIVGGGNAGEVVDGAFNDHDQPHAEFVGAVERSAYQDRSARWSPLNAPHIQRKTGDFEQGELADDALRYGVGYSGLDGRSFCPKCGARLFCLHDEDVEIRFGSLDDAPTQLVPRFEIWTRRREVWLHPLEGADQHDEDPPK